MMTRSNQAVLPLHDQSTSRAGMRREVLDGLRDTPRRISSKFFYDEAGSRLFDEICDLDEYYLTRTELGIMRDQLGDMVRVLGSNCRLIEFGSGSSLKTRMLLDRLHQPHSYVPIDISRDYLRQVAQELARQYPHLDIVPVCGDFTQRLDLPRPEQPAARRVVYFPGSTIGNFTPHSAVSLLRQAARLVGPGGGLLLGADMKKDPTVITRAYNDAKGVTARFNLNLLTRFNRELGADFQVDQFWHHAFYNAREGRIEMHLVSQCDQSIRLGSETVFLGEGESIHTENSYKFTRGQLERLAAEAGFRLLHDWTDEQRYFSVNYFTVASAS
ncbi:MAG: L-histidine N(alpha)-methyltransferase [Gemmataceae bacterium]